MPGDSENTPPCKRPSRSVFRRAHCVQRRNPRRCLRAFVRVAHGPGFVELADGLFRRMHPSCPCSLDGRWRPNRPAPRRCKKMSVLRAASMGRSGGGYDGRQTDDPTDAGRRYPPPLVVRLWPESSIATRRPVSTTAFLKRAIRRAHETAHDMGIGLGHDIPIDAVLKHAVALVEIA